VGGRVGPAASKEAQARRLAVIRALWFTECTLAAIGERLGISGTRVSVLAKRASLPPRSEYNRSMPKPRVVPPEPEARKPPKKIPPTAEQTAKIVTAKLPTLVGMPQKAEVTLRLVLPRAALERLTARAIRETRKLEAVVQEILEHAATESLTPRPARGSR
jgi:hypothetical protein